MQHTFTSGGKPSRTACDRVGAEYLLRASSGPVISRLYQRTGGPARGKGGRSLAVPRDGMGLANCEGLPFVGLLRV